MAIPRLEGEARKLQGIPTPVLQSAANLVMAIIAGGNHTLIGCALVRNDVLLFTALNNDLSYRNRSRIFAVSNSTRSLFTGGVWVLSP